MSSGVGSDHPIFSIQALKDTFWSWMSWVSLVQLTVERTKEKKILERKGLRKKNSFIRFEVLRGKKKKKEEGELSVECSGLKC